MKLIIFCYNSVTFIAFVCPQPCHARISAKTNKTRWTPDTNKLAPERPTAEKNTMIRNSYANRKCQSSKPNREKCIDVKMTALMICKFLISTSIGGRVDCLFNFTSEGESKVCCRHFKCPPPTIHSTNCKLLLFSSNHFASSSIVLTRSTWENYDFFLFYTNYLGYWNGMKILFGVYVCLIFVFLFYSNSGSSNRTKATERKRERDTTYSIYRKIGKRKPKCL